MGLGTTTIAVAIAFTVISGVILTLRCVSRFYVVRKADLDDWFAILAWLVSLTATCITCIEWRYGLGEDMQHISFPDLTKLLKFSYLYVITYGCGLVLVKVSALLQYQRFIFDRWPRLLCKILNFYCICCGIVALVLGIAPCQPITYAWDKTIPGGKCLDLRGWYFAGSAHVIITDILVVILPVVVFRNVNMPRSQRLALILIFALGGVGCLVSILRLRSLVIADISHYNNFSRDFAPAARWSTIEINIGITCISLPPLKALFDAAQSRFKKKVDKSSERSLEDSNASTLVGSVEMISIENTPKKRELDPYAIP